MHNLSAQPPTSGDKWIEKILEKSQEVTVGSVQQALITTLVDFVYANFDSRRDRRIALAASFDLVLMAEYYRTVGHLGWVYCPEGHEALLLYPYTNVCPRCVLKNVFVFHKANKPKSGVIGAKTSRLLGSFLQTLLKKNKRSIQVLKGSEPVDLVLVDDTGSKPVVMFAEIKAAPLVTLPLAYESQRLTGEQIDSSVITPHRVADHSNLYGSELKLFLPDMKQANNNWRLIKLGSKNDAKDVFWAYRALSKLIQSDPDLLYQYFDFWRHALETYEIKSQNDIYWLANASGQPSPRPNDWPRRKSASGYESVSDGKTSVGMDRTDDLKKATYQVLKIGAEAKPSSKYDFRVGIFSNIHAIRHHKDYLSSLEQIVWTRSSDVNVETAKDLAEDTPLFNLFDGVIALTDSMARDAWVQTTFDF